MSRASLEQARRPAAAQAAELLAQRHAKQPRKKGSDKREAAFDDDRHCKTIGASVAAFIFAQSLAFAVRDTLKILILRLDDPPPLGLH